MSSEAAANTAARRSAGYATLLLMVIYAFNFIDRSIINILAEPIKEDLGLSDTQLGLLGGIAFALLYASLGVPIARLADRYNRITIIAASLAVWSAVTAVCGFARNFPQLFLARVGVGMGEAGCTPPAHSLLADYHPPNRRASAIGVYSMGSPIGQLIGTVAGGWMAESLGWRMAFLVVGAPGLILAVLAKATMREPARGAFDPPPAASPPPFLAVLRTLFGNPVLRHVTAGVAVCTAASAGFSAFIAPLLIRSDFGVGLRTISLGLGLVFGGCVMAATGLGGWITDWAAARRDARQYLQIPALTILAGTPFYFLALNQQSFTATILALIVPQCVVFIYIGPVFAVLHNTVEPRMRASAAAVVFMILSLVGYGLGPTLVGFASDRLAAHAASLSPGEWASACAAPQIAPGQANSCRAASASGLRGALMLIVLLYPWAAFHFWRASQALGRQLREAT
jgi:predicted MFS family arabinose efflux permease